MGYSKHGTIQDERPDLANLLVNADDASNFRIGSAKKLDWRCPSCGFIIRQKAVNKIVARGLHCPVCKDGSSRPEKIVGSILRQSNIEAIHQATFPWSGRRRYDFFLPKYNCIIEVNGSQHYGFGFERLSGVTLEEQQSVDNDKQRLALSNGISHYLVINASNTSAEIIAIQVVQGLSSHGIRVSASTQVCEQDARTSDIVTAAKLWNDGMWTGEIAKALDVCTSAAIRYLNAAARAGMCDYSAEKAHKMSQRRSAELRRKKVRCVQTGEIFDSLASACEAYGISSASNIIRSCCNAKCHAGKYNDVLLKWEYVP